jgi:hypothetical protein
MIGRIPNGIRLRLDDPSNDPPFGQIADQVFTQQEAREVNRIDGKIVAV